MRWYMPLFVSKHTVAWKGGVCCPGIAFPLIREDIHQFVWRNVPYLPPQETLTPKSDLKIAVLLAVTMANGRSSKHAPSIILANKDEGFKLNQCLLLDFSGVIMIFSHSFLKFLPNRKSIILI